jgi:hypothetical protein
LQPAGTLLWSRASGWDVTPATPADTYCFGSIRFETALASQPEIRLAYERVIEACR